MNIVFESAPEGTTHFLRYASGYIVWCKIDKGHNNQLILSEWDGGNEYWVPGIFPVEHYQKIGLTSIDDLPTQNDAGQDAAAPKGATHCYHHGGETSWYRETEDSLFVWRDGSWYASTQKSAKELARVCPFGAVTILAQEVQLADDSEDDLTWFARNVHQWPAGEHQPWCYVGTGYHDKVRVARGTVLGMSPAGRVRITRDQWLSRRAELQNKPEEWPSNANWLAQDADGGWSFYTDHADNPPQCHGENAWYSDDEEIITKNSGDVLGSWRDTLERRPVDLSEPAVTARLTEATENVLAAAPALMDEKFSFDRGDWFERGELPPAGTECEFCNSDDEWTDWHRCIFVGKDAHGAGVISIIGDDAGMLYRSGNPKDFRPIRIERDKVLECMMKDSGALPCETTESIMLNLYDAGYRKQEAV